MAIGSEPKAQRQEALASGLAAGNRLSSSSSSSSGPNRATAVAEKARTNAVAPVAPALANEDNDPFQSIYDVADEMETAPVEETPRCPQCRSPMEGGAVLCVTCGYDSRTGQRVAREQPKPGLLSGRGTMNEQKPSLLEKLLAQWPGLVGLLLIGWGVLWVWYVHTYGGYINFGACGLIFGLGIAALGYWSVANRNANSNF